MNNLIWVPVFLLLIYAPAACYHDLKYREMPAGFWTLLWVIGIPVTILLYAARIYPWYLGGLSLAVSVVYFMLERLDIIQGADFMYLLWITLFFVQNPLNGHILIPVSFSIFLLAAMISFGILANTPLGKKYLVSENLPGFPMMLPISLALVLTVVLG